jgi:hypothetical protein
MDARQLLSMIFFPWHVRNDVLLTDRSPGWKDMALSSTLIAIEGWMLVITIEYWWFGQIFIKSTLLLLVAFVMLFVVLSAVISRRFKVMLTWNAMILALPAIASFIATILLRFGLIPPNAGPYIYQIPGLMILACGSIAWLVCWKFAAYSVQFKDKKYRTPKIVKIMDVIGFVSWGLLVIFIKYVMRVFYLF